jgi:diguanylate cyclase (GGDEF)-like protein
MNPSRPKILVVDDTLANLVVMRRLLSRVEAEVHEVRSGAAALAACEEHEFALILLDINMPEIDGYTVAARLAENATQRETPIIFVTAAYSDDLDRLKGYQFGAVDFIAKPVNDIILLSKVRVFLELHRGKLELKKALEELFSHNRRLQVEIAERERAENDARHKATHDALTGLANRPLFMDRLETAIERARRRGKLFALAYIDIDGFKPVNDTHGHQVGDKLLRAIAERLVQSVRGEDTVARLGGDEFAIIMEEALDAPQMALSLCQHVGKSLREPYAIEMPEGSLEVHVGASFGLAIYPLHAQECDPLIRVADAAMYAAKRSGKNRCVVAEDPVAENAAG